MNINRTQDFSISLTKVVGTPHHQGRVLPQSQLQGAEPRRRRRRVVPGQHQLRQRHGEPARHRLRLRQCRARRVHQLPAAVEVRRRQLHLQPGGLVRPGQLEGQLQADARLRPALRQPAAAVRPVPPVVELLPGALVAGRGTGALRARLRGGQSLLGHEPSGAQPADGPAARAEHVAGDRPARAQHGRRAQRHRQGGRRHREGQLRVADVGLRAARRRGVRPHRLTATGPARRLRAVLRSPERQLGLLAGRQPAVLDGDDRALLAAAEPRPAA